MADPNSNQMLIQRIRRQIKKGKSRLIIINDLVTSGWDRKEAEKLVGSVDQISSSNRLTPEERKKLDKKIRNMLIEGFVFLLGGLALSFYLYSQAEDGSKFKIIWISMAFGLYYIIRGTYLWYINRD